MPELTPRAKHVLVKAQEQARAFGYTYIGTDHLVLGLLEVQPSPAVSVLTALEVPLDRLSELILTGMLDHHRQPPVDYLPFTPQVKKVLEFAVDEAGRLNLDYVGTEHLLVGIMQENRGEGGQTLMELGVKLDAVRARVAALSTPRGAVSQSHRK